MSTDVTKVCFRFRLSHLDRLTPGERLAYFRRLIGEPETLFWKDGNEDGFLYTNLAYAKENPTEFREFVRPVHTPRGDRWGAEVILCILNHDTYLPIGLYPHIGSAHRFELHGIEDKLIALGFASAEVWSGGLYAYTWYNGVDEPINFD